MGCSETAVFVTARTIEGLIDDLLLRSISKGKVKDFDLKNTKLENKIGKLKAISLIEEKEFHILQKLKFDRNDFGHPFERQISFTEAKRIIMDALDLIKILENKLKEIKSESEIEEEKILDLLGGKTKAGLPTLYGTPQQKLEQLKGYGGERIEEMREKLMKEVGE